MNFEVALGKGPAVAIWQDSDSIFIHMEVEAEEPTINSYTMVLCWAVTSKTNSRLLGEVLLTNTPLPLAYLRNRIRRLIPMVNPSNFQKIWKIFPEPITSLISVIDGILTRPKSGSMLLYSRKKVRYRRDGYCWKKRKDGKTTREDHMKLKVQGTECIYGCYVHSAILPTFHRRCYWLLQNPDIVLVHYLNVPYPDDTKMTVITPNVTLWTDKKEWTKEELVSQLKPMFFSEDEPDINNELEISTAETVEAIVSQLMEKQRVARQAALVKQLECGCPDSTCAVGKTCLHPMRRITSTKIENIGSLLPSQSTNCSTSSMRTDNSNQVTSTTGTATLIHAPRVYSRDRNNQYQYTQLNTTDCSGANVNSITNVISGSTVGSRGCSNSNSTPPIVLSLSQIQSGGGLIILNSKTNKSMHGSSSVGDTTSGHHSIPAVLSAARFGLTGCKENHQSSTVITGGTKPIGNAIRTIMKQEPLETNQQLSSNNILNSTKKNNNICKKYNNINGNQKQSKSICDQYICKLQTPLAEVSISRPSTSSTQIITSEDNDKDHYKKYAIVYGTDFHTSSIIKSSQEHQDHSMLNRNSSNFYSETLDLSQEDVQRTLSANMPILSNAIEASQHANSLAQQMDSRTATLGSNRSNNTLALAIRNHRNIEKNRQQRQQLDLSSEINPLDFTNPGDSIVSQTNIVDDDVFVNLDAFDMLADFPDLEVLDPVEHSASLLEGTSLDQQNHNISNESCKPINGNDSDSSAINTHEHNKSTTHENSIEAALKITDYSPEWAYPDGGVKVLVTGPWNSTSPYTVLFDTFSVPTTIVQSGVLRCHCPAHEEGLVTLQVASDGYVISNSVIFEYKSPPKQEQLYAIASKVERSNDNLLKFTLLQRLEAMDDRLQIKQEPVDSSEDTEDTSLFTKSNLEDRLVAYCQRMTSRVWRDGEELSVDWFSSHRGMTILHLAASLGYSRLVCAILHWRAENSSLLLETEVDALSQDEDGFTPLMWACVNGHTETAVMLYKWNHTALNILNHIGQSALECANVNGFQCLKKSLERLENMREKASQLLLLSTEKNALTQQNDCISSTHIRNDAVKTTIFSSSSDTVSPASSVTSLLSIASTSQSHDGVFLKPGEVTRITRSLSLPLQNSTQSQEVAYIFENGNNIGGTKDIDFSLWEQDVRVLTLAEQIIAAMPDRIKKEDQHEDMLLDISPGSVDFHTHDIISDVLMEPLLDQSSSSFESNDMFEFFDYNYRYYDVNTPCSSLSPAPSSCLHSPRSFTVDSPTPPPTTADFCEFFQASGSPFEQDFSNLTLSDQEQRELYDAAKTIQKAYRSYKGRQQKEQNKEKRAAILIQKYYRRYKEYAYFKQMTHAAMVIQNRFRSYCEHKRFKKSQEAALCIQNYYRNYKEQSSNYFTGRMKSLSSESSDGLNNVTSSGLKRTYSQRRQHQAARKIQQFMRQSKNKQSAIPKIDGCLPALPACLWRNVMTNDATGADCGERLSRIPLLNSK